MANSITAAPADIYNQALLANVRPSNWVNPTPAPRYNLVVIGAGTAGLVSAAGAAGLGARVALVERHLFGGDCLNVGCVPSKGLLRSARSFAEVRDAAEFGITVPADVQVDFAAIMQRMRRLRARISANDSVWRFRDLGVDVFLGEGRFTRPDSLEVAGSRLRFSKAVIATGTRPAEPPIPGLSEAGFQTNETIFSLTTLPARLAVIGAGPIGCELAQAFARFGAKVLLLNKHARILQREDREAVELVEREMRRDGVELIPECEVNRVQIQGDERILEISRGGAKGELRAQEILVAVGRRPNVEGLNLEAAGVAYDLRAGVQVNNRLQTTNPRIFAAGDICSRYKFTHAADAMARIVLRNALFHGRAAAGRLIIPWCTYTDPEVAHVGLYEREANEQGIAIQTFVQELQEVDRAILDGETNGFVKIHVRKGTDRIVGATVVARHAGDLISEITLAMVGGLGLGTLAQTIHPYPTQIEAIKKAADAYNRTRLTGLAKSLFKKWFAWTR
jgi:pyruvate/2-oxoglutarate dehydrogenase complex dihydrolipoamide dehydrogenase (E3) component